MRQLHAELAPSTGAPTRQVMLEPGKVSALQAAGPCVPASMTKCQEMGELQRWQAEIQGLNEERSRLEKEVFALHEERVRASTAAAASMAAAAEAAATAEHARAAAVADAKVTEEFVEAAKLERLRVKE